MGETQPPHDYLQGKIACSAFQIWVTTNRCPAADYVCKQMPPDRIDCYSLNYERRIVLALCLVSHILRLVLHSNATPKNEANSTKPFTIHKSSTQNRNLRRHVLYLPRALTVVWLRSSKKFAASSNVSRLIVKHGYAQAAITKPFLNSQCSQIERVWQRCRITSKIKIIPVQNGGHVTKTQAALRLNDNTTWWYD